MVPSNECLCIETILSEDTAWPWQEFQSGSVDLRTKRRAFDLVMAVKRLQEEKKILMAEMNQHWKYLLHQMDSLKELSEEVSNAALKSTATSLWGLPVEVLKVLQSLLLRKRQNTRKAVAHARSCYLKVFSQAETSNILQSFSDNSDSDSDMSDDML
ncbi:uncharacterized protein [Nothobranchius furzeri]|uniref:uncharacterized protein n=1 Tax=Nothobranchius furzeri TaxID=105023 RepID=UPI00390496B3